jgi:hypothetical protein
MPELDPAMIEQWIRYAIENGINWGTAIALALLIFYIGRWVVGRIVAAVNRLMLARGVDETLVSFICSMLRWVGLLFVTIAALSQLGIDTTSLVALLGAAGLAIGLSLQSSLANFAAGVMLIVFKPFKKGDFIDAGGAMGTVESDQYLHHRMTTPDNKEVIVPNGAIIGATSPTSRPGPRGAWTWSSASPTTTTSCARREKDPRGDCRRRLARPGRAGAGGHGRRAGGLQRELPRASLGERLGLLGACYGTPRRRSSCASMKRGHQHSRSRRWTCTCRPLTASATPRDAQSRCASKRSARAGTADSACRDAAGHRASPAPRIPAPRTAASRAVPAIAAAPGLRRPRRR